MYDRILIVVEQDTPAEAAVAEGMALARVHGAELVFFAMVPRIVMPVTEMVIADLPAPEELQREARAEAERRLNDASAPARLAGLRCRQTVGTGIDDADGVVQAAVELQCSLIVVASAGRNAVMRLITGSLIPGLITRSPVPVLVCGQASAHGPAARPASTASAGAAVEPGARP